MYHSHHFVYASSGSSIGQWLMAHRAGGRLVGGAVHLRRTGDRIGTLRPGEVVEIDARSPRAALAIASRVRDRLAAQGLDGVCVGRLLRDSGQPV
jgi:hypothetical protein